MATRAQVITRIHIRSAFEHFRTRPSGGINPESVRNRRQFLDLVARTIGADVHPADDPTEQPEPTNGDTTVVGAGALGVSIGHNQFWSHLSVGDAIQLTHNNGSGGVTTHHLYITNVTGSEDGNTLSFECGYANPLDKPHVYAADLPVSDELANDLFERRLG